VTFHILPLANVGSFGRSFPVTGCLLVTQPLGRGEKNNIERNIYSCILIKQNMTGSNSYEIEQIGITLLELLYTTSLYRAKK
jgi:hypothetical protein